MSSLKLYFGLAWKDVIRLWAATQLQIVIIAGICLPILLLLGLKRGHVAELREELVKSPTGRQIIFWSGNEENFLDQEKLSGLKETMPAIEFIIPESQRLLFYTRPADTEENVSAETLGVTLYSTVPGDPILEQFGVGINAGEDEELVVSQVFAEAAGLQQGDEIKLLAKRRIRSEKGEDTLSFTVGGIIPAGDSSDAGNIAYASISVMDKLEAYSRGNAVLEWSVPAMDGLKAVDTYQKMLCVCLKEPDSYLTVKDRDFLSERGLQLREANSATLPEFFSLLKPDALESIVVYEVWQPQESEEFRSIIRDAPKFLSANTEAVDDLFLRWCEPAIYNVSGKDVRLVGATFPFGRETGGWIQEFVRDDANWFNFDDSVATPNSYRASSQANALELVCEGGDGSQTIPLMFIASTGEDTSAQDQAKLEAGETVLPQKTDDADPNEENESSDPFLCVPVTLMAYLEQIKAGKTVFDTATNSFVEVPRPIAYTKARLYTKTIDSVPGTVDSLSDNGFAVLSESSRIAEIHEQDQSLQILVAVTAGGVFLFGVLTVFNVLVDSTDRKRGTIGVLRVMGISKFGIFSIVLMRASVIGMLAAILCIVAGSAAGKFLSVDMASIEALAWKPTVSIVTSAEDLLLVASGAAFCAIAGAVVPAFKASRLDPFDAIMEGRFN